MTKNHSTKIEAKIKGVENLYLTITDGGNGYSCDWADWANPVLIDDKGKEIQLTSMKWKSAKADWGQVRINRNAGGQPLRINGKKIEFGIGAHANSVIHYVLPKGHKFQTFNAIGGIDNGGSDQKGGKDSSVQFFVSDKPLLISKIKASSEIPQVDHFPPEQLIVPEGLEVKLWAKSPLFYNPTNMDIDHKGRIWVAEGRNYRGKRTQPNGDRIVVVEDKNADGIAESSHVFVQEMRFISPLGISVVDNKIIVAQPPDLIVYTDVNRNLRFDPELDKREVLLTGFDGKNHDHSLHSVTVGPNGQYYLNFGNKGAQVTDKDGWQLNAGSFYSMKNISGKPSSDGQVYLGGVAFRLIRMDPGFVQLGTIFVIPTNKLLVHWVMFFKMIMMIRRAERHG